MCNLARPGHLAQHFLTSNDRYRSALSHQRTKTPPQAGSHMANRSASMVASPPRHAYPGLQGKGSNEWGRNPADQEEDDDDDDDDEIVYDDDEDEFGLPSLASMRRKKALSSKNKNLDSGYSARGSPSALGFGLAAMNRQRANSSDIAEERGTPMYPTARKTEGKILRPQYKDILRGTFQEEQAFGGYRSFGS